MTRGQCGWLDLHCLGLAPFYTLPACPGADPNAAPQPHPEAGAQRTLEGVGWTRWFGRLLHTPSGLPSRLFLVYEHVLLRHPERALSVINKRPLIFQEGFKRLQTFRGTQRRR